MSMDVRIPTDDDWSALCRADARSFGVTYTDEEIERLRPVHDLSRFRFIADAGQVVAVAGSYAFDVTLPGGVCVPMGGVTWVATAPTHRGQGLMRRVVEAVHADIDERGEPVATLYASQGGIYQHLDYGVATRRVETRVNPRAVRMRKEFRVESGSVRIVDDEDEVLAAIEPLWDRFRRTRAGEVSRPAALSEFIAERSRVSRGKSSAATYLVHEDGYAKYTTVNDWNRGHPAFQLDVVELAAVTPQAHAALWNTLLAMDLVGEVESSRLPIDDPLPFMVDNQREVRTVGNCDGVWVNVRDIPIAFGARSYRSEDRFVVEVGERRWAIEGGPDGGSCRRVRTRADLVTDHAGLSSLLYGGQLPSALVAGRRMTARTDDVLHRADIFFTTSQQPNCQTGY